MIKRLRLFTLAVSLLLPLGSARAQDALPEGSGKKAVQSYCVQCHAAVMTVWLSTCGGTVHFGHVKSSETTNTA